MRIYITTQGTKLIREGRHLLVKKGTDTWQTLFIDKMKQLLVFGRIELTAPARNLLLQHGVDTVFLTEDGRYRGRYELPEPKNIFLRIKQFNLLNDTDFGIKCARWIVAGKITNMMTLLQRMKRTRKQKKPGTKAGEIKRLLTKLETADSVDSVRGYEGAASAHYFSVFGRGFNTDQGFRHRVRRPPTDPVNSVLSLLYTFLFNRVFAAIRINHLDPYPAFLHTPDYGRTSLALDLMEEFRVIIVDSLTLALFNLGVIRHKDFIFKKVPAQEILPEAQPPDITNDPYGFTLGDETKEHFDLPPQRMSEQQIPEDIRDGKLPVRLTPEAMKRVIENFERKMTTEFHYLPYDKKITYAEAIIAQAGEYRKVIEGTYSVYQPLLLK